MFCKTCNTSNDKLEADRQIDENMFKGTDVVVWLTQLNWDLIKFVDRKQKVEIYNAAHYNQEKWHNRLGAKNTIFNL